MVDSLVLIHTSKLDMPNLVVQETQDCYLDVTKCYPFISEDQNTRMQYPSALAGT